MDSTEDCKKKYKEQKKKRTESLEGELNIRYHDINQEWNYTISPRSTSEIRKHAKK